MSVKTIFKVLIGSIVLMTVSFLVIELYNISVSAMQIKQMTRMAARQACILFTQENYKQDTGDQKGGATYCNSVYDRSGKFYIDGDFYGTTNPRSIWNEVFVNNSEFAAFCNLPTMQKYTSLKILKKAYDSHGNISIPEITWDSSADELQANIEAQSAQSYWDNMYTTVNLGIPYLDKTITNKMFQWNLAQLLSNCDSDLIYEDDLGVVCVNYKGFKCYVDKATITDYEYTVYDLSTSTGRASYRSDIGPIYTTSDSGEGVGDSNTQAYNNATLSDNSLVTVVGITYTIPMRYEGVTPLRRLIEYTWNNDVDGLGNGHGITGADESLTTSTTDLVGGGTHGNTSGELPVSGRLIYTLVR